MVQLKLVLIKLLPKLVHALVFCKITSLVLVFYYSYLLFSVRSEEVLVEFGFQVRKFLEGVVKARSRKTGRGL